MVIWPRRNRVVALPKKKNTQAAPADISVRVRRVQAADMASVIGLDTRVTKLPKNEYWNDIFRRYGKQRLHERFFLVAEGRAERANPRVLGFIIGEIRAWEFGSTPCGWVFALSVEPDVRVRSIGKALIEAISQRFKKAGVTKMRTMVARDAQLLMLFFRSEGMMAGPYLQLEKDLD
jgi:ribosomal protein S18 acetylase RimI-like enzyme